MMQFFSRIVSYTFGGGISALVLLVFLCCAANSAFAQIPVPVMVHYFDTGGFGAISADGVTAIASGPFAGGFAVVDNNPDTVFIADRNGILKQQIPIGGFALTATGVAFVPDTQFFAVVDSGLDEVIIFNTAGIVQKNFDTDAFECNNPQGITYITSGANTGNFAIVDSSADAVFIVDDTGGLQDSFSTIPAGASNPRGISFISGTDNFAILDDSLDDVIIVDSSGILQQQFDVGFVSTSNLGIAYDPASDNFPIASANEAQVFFIDADGEVVTNFSTFLFGSTQPTGITYIPAMQKYAIVDIDTDRVYFVNTDGSNPTNCAINTFSTSPVGITYIPQTGNLAVVDNLADEVFIIDQTCNLLSQFDIATFGINALTATGITSIPGGSSTIGQFDIIDASTYRDAIKRVDPVFPGRIQSQFSTGGLEFFAPDGITLIDDTAHLAMVDNSRDDAFVVDSRGVMLALFDTTPFSTTPRGIAFDSDTGRIAIVDSLSDLVTIMDLPGLLLLPELCACDLNNDGSCNILDYQMFIQDWGCTDCP